MRRFRKLKDDERGVTLVEMVFAMALFFVIGSTFVFAMSTISGTSDDSNQKANSAMAQSGISNAFRTDIASAKAFKIDGAGYNMLLAKNDGTCVKWSFVNGADGNKGYALGRSTASGAPAPAATQFFQYGLSGPNFYNYNNMLRVRFLYSEGPGYKIYTQEARLKVASSDGGGVCW